MQTVSQPGMMGHPHGLDEPLFRADFVNPHQQFKAYSADRLANPRVRLCFYDIKDQERIKAIIKTEEIYSWDIPVYFAETTDYLVITSPTYINGGNYTAEATALYEPLGAALKAYFNSKR